jgi:amidohydrolase
MQEELAGTVKFIFQPAEEGPPEGERGGAELMTDQGVLTNPDVDVVFGLHIWSLADVGTISYRSGPFLASVQDYRILVKGRQAHGSTPWMSVDPVVTASQIVLGLQTIVARSVDITDNPAVVSVGKFAGGVRSNIIPEEVELVGTIRTFDPEQTALVHRRIREIATNIAESAGAEVEIQLPFTSDYPVTYNDPELTDRSLAVLTGVAGADNVREVDLITGAEDFSYFAQQVPGFYFFIGGKPLDVPDELAPSHHTPDFFVSEDGMALGVKSLLSLTLDYLNRGTPATDSP